MYRTELKTRRTLSPKAFEIVISRPPGFTFKSGQRIQLTHEGVMREYTPVSGPGKNALTLCIRYIEKGRISAMLNRAPPGSRFDISGPHGYFFFHPSPRRPVFVATGTGIAPFYAMARDGVENFILLHGVKSSGELYYADYFRSRTAVYIGCLSDPSSPASGQTFRGRVTGYLDKELPEGSYDFYLCGAKEMIRDATLIIDERFPESRIYSEPFH